jgi:hypothetical protein
VKVIFQLLTMGIYDPFLIRQIALRRLDITGSYHAWFSIGCDLVNDFGETGREYFHQISQFHPDYRYDACGKQSCHCLKHRYGYSIGTVMYYMHLEKAIRKRSKGGRKMSHCRSD